MDMAIGVPKRIRGGRECRDRVQRISFIISDIHGRIAILGESHHLRRNVNESSFHNVPIRFRICLKLVYFCGREEGGSP